MKYLFFLFALCIGMLHSQAQTKSYAFARKNGQWGLIDEQGKNSIPFAWDILYTPTVFLAPYLNESKSLLYHPSEGLLKFRERNRFGYISLQNKVVIQSRFVHASDFNRGYAIVFNGVKYGIIDTLGNYLFEPTKYELLNEREGLVLFRHHKKYGFMDLKGNLVIPSDYDDAFSFHEGLAAVSYKHKYGYINLKGEWIIQPSFDNAKSFHKLRAVVTVGLGVGLIDEKGNWLLKPVNQELIEAGDGYYKVKRNMSWGLLDSLGREVIPCKYGQIGDIFNQQIILQNGINSGVSNLNYKFIIPFSAAVITTSGEGYYLVQKDFMSCFYNQKGQRLNDTCYEKASDFSEGLARVIVGGKIGFIDTTGAMVIEPQFENAYDFHAGRCRARINKEWGFINRQGQYIMTPEFEHVSDYFSVTE
ncbi:MAG TPA: WG repeat-containing protein [Chitinophagaceae bacterium]|nr:WG repeat-containing protein [Chitinophagaceae bacterium]